MKMEDSSGVDAEEVYDPSLEEEEEKLATMLLSGNDDNDDDDDDDDKDSLLKKWSETERKSIIAKLIFNFRHQLWHFSIFSSLHSSLVIKWFRKWEKLIILWA